MEMKPIEVIMRVESAASNGIEIVARAKKVSELVRCGKCKYYDEEDEICYESGSFKWKPNDFCSYGKRREDE